MPAPFMAITIDKAAVNMDRITPALNAPWDHQGIMKVNAILDETNMLGAFQARRNHAESRAFEIFGGAYSFKNPDDMAVTPVA